MLIMYISYIIGFFSYTELKRAVYRALFIYFIKQGDENYMITSYPNSKFLTIKRDKVNKEAGKWFLCAYNDNIAYAMVDLSNSCFKVYMCLLMNRDGYMEVFSPQNVSKITGLHPDTVRKSFRELETKKYILPVEGTSAYYCFYEKWQDENKAPRTDTFNKKAKQLYPSYFTEDDYSFLESFEM